MNYDYHKLESNGDMRADNANDDGAGTEEGEEKATENTKNHVLFILQSVVLGMSYSIIWPTLWPCMSDAKFKREHLTSSVTDTQASAQWVSTTWYGLTYFAYPVVSVICANSIKYIRRGNINISFYLLLFNMFEITGHLLYSLNHCAPTVMVVGRCFAGIGDVSSFLIGQEIRRVYDGVEQQRINLHVVIAYLIGMLIAPLLTLATMSVDFHITSTWHIDRYNVAGFNMMIIFIVMQVCVIALYTPLPCDYKPQVDKDPSISSIDGTSASETQQPQHIYQSLSGVYVLLLGFLQSFTIGLLEVTYPLKFWDVEPEQFSRLAASYLLITFIYAIIFLSMLMFAYAHNLHIWTTFTVIITLVGLCALLAVEMDPSASLHRAGLVLQAIVIACAWGSDTVFFIQLTSSIVPPSIQDDTSIMRQHVSKLGFLLATLMVALLYEYLILIVACLLFALSIAYFVYFGIKIRQFGEWLHSRNQVQRKEQ